MNKLNCAKNIDLPKIAYIDSLTLNKEIKQKHINTAKTHSYSVDDLSGSINCSRINRTNSLTNLVDKSDKLRQLKCFNSTRTIAKYTPKENETKLSLSNLIENLPSMNNVNLINWLLYGTESNFSKMIFVHFLNKTIQKLVGETFYL